MGKGPPEPHAPGVAPFPGLPIVTLNTVKPKPGEVIVGYSIVEPESGANNQMRCS